MVTLTIRTKVVLIIVSVASLGLSLGAALMLLHQRAAMREDALESTRALANTVAEYVTAPLLFEDAEGARAVLAKLATDSVIRQASVLDDVGVELARFSRVDTPIVATPARVESTEFVDDGFIVAKVPVVHRSEQVGTLQLVASTAQLEARLARDLEIVVAGCLVLIALCALAAFQLQRLITGPIVTLSAAMRRISEGGALTERVEAPSEDEIGALYRGYNRMLDEVRQRTDALDASEGRLRALMSALPERVVVLDEEGAELETLAGQEVEPLFEASLPHEVRQRILAALVEASDSRQVVALEYVLGREGKTHTFDARFVPLRMLSDRGARMLVAVVREVTEHRVLEAQLLQSRKLEAVGQLAGGVAHDFNNMLAGIMGYAELLKLRAKDTDTAHAASEIVSISEHAAELTARLLAFSRRKKAQSAPTDVHELAERVCGILKHTVDRRIEVRLDGDRRGCCVVEGDPAQLESALLNLALNARDAMPEGGTLTLRMRCVVPDAVLRDKLPAPQAETYVQLEVEDTGEGIDPAILDRIFEPFFTTKAPGRGSGLGLAAVYGAVSAHHGLVDVRSTLGQGTCFRLLLPCAGQAVRAKLEEATHMVAPGGHVLVVDDEQAVRQTATLCLEEAGYRVSGAADGRAALELVRSGARFDLVLLDMIMPVMGGAEVLRELRRVAPGLPVLIASGYSPGEAEVAGADGFLQKPYRRAELLKRVAALLGPRRRAAGDA